MMSQADVWPLAPSLGIEGLWPAPYTADGVPLSVSPALENVASLEQTLRMHVALAQHDDISTLLKRGLIFLVAPSSRKAAKKKCRSVWR